MLKLLVSYHLKGIFSHNSQRFLAKVHKLDAHNVRERDLVFGLFIFYDLLIEKYKEKNNIKKQNDNKTKLLQKMIDKNLVSENEINALENSEILNQIDFTMLKKKENEKDKSQSKESKPRYYL